MPLPSLLTSTEAAALAGVTPSTIKRWSDAGLLPCVRTAGGHRRFERVALEKCLRSLSETSDENPYEQDWLWIETLITGHRHDIDPLLLETRARLGTWAAVADHIGTVLTAMGRLWHLGQLSIADEHTASESLTRALTRMGDALPCGLNNRICVLATPPKDPHTLGLSLAELCVREAGWTPRWIGTDTPSSELLRIIREHAPTMLALSASSISHEAPELHRMAQELAQACAEHSVTLVLGGSGAWPTDLPHTLRITSYTHFRTHLLSF